MGGIQAEARGRDAGSMCAKNVYGIQKVHAVMALGAGKVHQDRKLCFQVRVPAAEHIQDAPIIPVFFLAVPSPEIVRFSFGMSPFLVKYISANNHKNIPITVVPIMGAADINSPEKDGLDLSKDLASAYGGKYQYIYAPLFVKNKEVKESLIQDGNIKGALELAQNADVILTSVGSIIHKSWRNYLSSKTLDILEKKGAIGHIGGRFFDICGKELDTSLAERMIGIDFGKLKGGQELVCIACGEKKAEPVLGAIRGHYIGTLIAYFPRKCLPPYPF